MVDKQVLSQMKTLVNNPQLMNSFNNYIDAKIQEEHRILEQSDDTLVVQRSQGAVAVLRRLKRLRDEVNGENKK
jgi:hydrogenase maturation factor HypF (carbamoyltransferase family)